MLAGTQDAPALTEHGTPGPLRGSLCWLLARASHNLLTEMMAALEELGLTPRGHMVLCTAASGEYTQTELAKMVGLDKTTMVVTVDELEAAGFAERRPSPKDRRARVIAVSEAGAAKLREAEGIHEGVNADVLAALPPEAREPFVDALGTLVRERLAEPAYCAHAIRRRM